MKQFLLCGWISLTLWLGGCSDKSSKPFRTEPHLKNPPVSSNTPSKKEIPPQTKSGTSVTQGTKGTEGEVVENPVTSVKEPEETEVKVTDPAPVLLEPLEMHFSPVSPAKVLGNQPLEVALTLSPPGGTLSLKNIQGGETQGNFELFPEKASLLFSGAVQVGRAQVEVHYEFPSRPSLMQIYELEVESPGEAQLEVEAPEFYTIGQPALSISVKGTPEGGRIEYGARDTQETGGSFSYENTSASEQTFRFGGATQAGKAFLLIRYLPTFGAFVEKRCEILVLPQGKIQAYPEELFYTLGQAPLKVEVEAGPETLAGSITYKEPDLGETQGQIEYENTMNNRTSFLFKYALQPGKVSLPITFTPERGEAVTLLYKITVLPKPFLDFEPLSPLAFSVGDPDQEVLVRGGQGQGFISFGKPDLGKTQGVFSYLDGESPNRFTFGDAKFAGTAKLPITFSPEFGEPVTLTYIIKIKSTFSPQLIFILGREEVSVLATGGPMKGIITYGEPDLEQTGGEFRFQSPEDSPSTFVFGHPERVGTTVLPVTFTPEIGRPITLNYTIEVVPVTELQFFPAPPFIFTVGDPDIRIKIRGGPLQGTVSYGTVDLGGTQGAFRFESGLEGEEWMIFGGAGKTGEVHLPVTFTPIKGDPLTLVYRIQVIPETLLQFELLPPVTQENKENKENKGKEATGTTPDDEKKE